MQYLTLKEIKQQCNIDAAYTGDDEYLTLVGEAAEDLASQLLDCPLEDVYAQYGYMPATIQHAMRMLVDHFYSVNRGSADDDKKIPDAVYIMLKLYRQFN